MLHRLALFGRVLSSHAWVFVRQLLYAKLSFYSKHQLSKNGRSLAIISSASVASCEQAAPSTVLIVLSRGKRPRGITLARVKEILEEGDVARF